MHKEAQNYIKRFPSDTQGGLEYATMDLLIGDGMVEASKTIDAGRKYLAKGFHDPIIYKILIRRSSECGLTDYAENLMAETHKRWPQMKEEFAQCYTPKVKQAPAAATTPDPATKKAA